jgi:hypothetical protein
MAMDTAEIANALLLLAVPAAAPANPLPAPEPAEDAQTHDIGTPDMGPAIFTGYLPADEVIAVFYDPRCDASGAELTPEVSIHAACTGTQIRLDGELVAELPTGAKVTPEDIALIPR